MITTKQIKRHIAFELECIGHEVTPKLVNQVFHNYMVSGDAELDVQDAIYETLGDNVEPQ